MQNIAIMTSTSSPKPLLFLLIVCLGMSVASAFATTSSQSPKKRRISNDRGGAGGFGKASKDSVPISHTRDDSGEISRLLDFLLGFKAEGLGGLDPGTEIGSSVATGRRGCYALKNHKKGDILCRVPSDCALALSDPSQMGGLDQTFAEGGHNFLRWYAGNDKARGMWESYLDSLPKMGDNFDPTPDFFSDEEIEALELPLSVRLAKEKRTQVAELAEREGLSFDELQFAAWIVSSRAFIINIDVGGEGPTKAGPGGGSDSVAVRRKSLRVLIPYLDMINHSSDNANAELHLIDPDKDEAWFDIRATRPIKAGKEITISYGTGFESSVELLNNYGFVADENRIDGRMMKKESDEIIQNLDGWNTCLEEDRRALEEGGDALGNMEKVLRFRIKLKESYSGKD